LGFRNKILHYCFDQFLHPAPDSFEILGPKVQNNMMMQSLYFQDKNVYLLIEDSKVPKNLRQK